MPSTQLEEFMSRDLDRVSDRVASAAEVRFAEVSPLLSGIVNAGGKRLRPRLLLLAARGFDYEEKLDTLIPAAGALELLHTASLIHDDTVDDATSRRGNPTLNTELDNASVILIGDYLFAQSAKLAAETESPRVISIFATILSDICDGQLMEMLADSALDQTREQYIERITGKTASLFAGAAEMGAYISNAPESSVQALRAYGNDVGNAFQIVDDVLDLTAAETTLGKPTGRDLREGTITLPVIYYLQQSPNGSSRLDDIAAVTDGSATESDVERVLSDIRSSSAIDAAYKDAEALIGSAKRNAEVVGDPDTRELLFEFADLAVDRNS